MKARLAKKIFKASCIYLLYYENCNTHNRYKCNPYWMRRWRYRAVLKLTPTTVVKSYDYRLDTALRRVPQYVSELLSAIKIKQMELKRRQWSKALELFKQQMMAKL